ncbi:hypothetical protein OXT66_02775 [Lentilactobacillus senioris]|uniref:hypothetical protein n=1 Tax=Lentilactobacillus senioris TaxID=931534 RepID=UPI00228192E7|nr:hypothetical protein [Lentilactobacillus senioris]MCY9806472.1 hypothetical protein [Lentilactobacillus senioris]
MPDNKKTPSKLPKWLKNTLEVVGSLTVFMAGYNLIGPLVYPDGRYFEWWTFPFSIILALIFVGLWSYHEERQAKKAAEQKLKAAQIEAEQLKKRQLLEEQAEHKAEIRRQKNAQAQKQHKK